MPNLENEFSFLNKTVEPNEVLPFAELVLRWPYRTEEIFSKEIDKLKHEKSFQNRLTVYELKNIYYQHTPVESFNYKGFLLKIEIKYLIQKEFEDIINNFSNYFVYKQDIFDIENENREYCALPSGHKKQFNDAICTRKNLPSFIPRLLYSLIPSGWRFKPEPDFEQIKIPVERIWPWLGPIDPPLPEAEITRTIPSDFEEIEFFVKAARELGQNNPNYLAKMIKYRYPEVSHSKLVDLIDPTYEGLPASKRQQGRRWLLHRHVTP